MPRIKIICCACGSEDIVRDAVATFNEQTQEWELAGVHDCESCNACGHESKSGAMDRVEIEGVEP